MRRLLLLGGGGHCKACIDVIEAQRTHTIAGVLVATGDPTTEVLGYPVLGHDDQLSGLLSISEAALVTVGQIKSANARVRLFSLLLKTGLALPVIQSPLSYVSGRASVGRGTILMHGAIVNVHAQIGENCIINSQALIEHDAQIGDHSHISTGARINGGAVVGERSFVGSAAVIKQGVRIGTNVVIGAGQTVLEDLPDGTWLKGGDIS